MEMEIDTVGPQDQQAPSQDGDAADDSYEKILKQLVAGKRQATILLDDRRRIRLVTCRLQEGRLVSEDLLRAEREVEPSKVTDG